MIDPKRERPPDPWPGPKGWYSFVEAEAFDLKPGWSVAESKGGGRDRILASGEHVIMSDGNKTADATSSIDVPADGRYLLALRVGAPTRKGPARDHTLNANARSMDVLMRLDDTNELVWPLERFAPNETELLWSQFEWVTRMVELKAGRTTIALRSIARATTDTNQRRVDCILLTSDTSNKPDHRDFAPQIYARIVLDTAPAPLAFAHPLTTGRVRRGAFTGQLANGESSGWLNVTRFFNGGVNDNFAITTTQKFDRAEYTVDFAMGPSNERIFKTVSRRGPGTDVRIAIPSHVSPAEPPMADFELSKQRAELVSKLPQVSFGRRPTRYPIMTSNETAEGVRADEMKVMAYVGVNGRTGLLDDVDLANGIVNSRLYNVAYYTREHGHLAPDLDATRRDLSEGARLVAASPNEDRIQHLKLIDEASPWSLDLLAADPLGPEKFRAWLRKNHFDPFSPEERRRLNSSGAERATRLVADRSTEFPGLYYLSQRFRASTIVDFFDQVTNIAHETYPPGIRTTQNFSDGAVLAANLYAQGNDYFDYFEKGALDVALTEDWCDGASTREFAAWNVALLRAATRGKRQPIHMYVIAYSGRRPVEVKVKSMEEISEGVKLLYLYDYLPKYRGGAQIGWAEIPLIWPAMAELTREIGAAEDVLVGAMPRPAETAIYYSIPGDIWTVGVDSAAGIERMSTYLALRHAQIPVDVVSGDQARGGALSKYKVVYLASEQVDRSDVPVLASWVKGGGTLVLGPGAASRDQWNRPDHEIDDSLRLPRHDVEHLQSLKQASGRYCRQIERQGTVSLTSGTALGVQWPEGETNVVAARQIFDETPDAVTLARYAPSNHAAAIALKRGRGAVVLWGFYPGIEYNCEAYRSWGAKDATDLVHPITILAAAKSVLDASHPTPDTVQMTRQDQNGVLPFRYPATLRAFLTAPALAAGVTRPLTISVPQVVASFMEGKEGWAVPLTNVTGSPIAKLDVIVSPGRPVRDVFSSRSGKLAPEQHNGTGFKVSQPLESTDILYGTWK